MRVTADNFQEFNLSDLKLHFETIHGALIYVFYCHDFPSGFHFGLVHFTERTFSKNAATLFSNLLIKLTELSIALSASKLFYPHL